MTNVLIFDTETSDKVDGEIIEAAYARVRCEIDLAGPAPDRIPPSLIWVDVIDEVYEARFQPERPMTMGSIAVHHILPSELEGREPSSSFKLPADTAYVIGHSVDFDWKAAGSPDIKRICTHAMAQHVFPEATGYSLVALIYHILGATETTRLMVKTAHGAATDVKLCLILLGKILRRHPDICTWSALWAFSEECRIPRTCPMKRYEGVPLENLEEGFVRWCLSQSWLDSYFRIGLERVMERRRPVRAFAEDSDGDGSPW